MSGTRFSSTPVIPRPCPPGHGPPPTPGRPHRGEAVRVASPCSQRCAVLRARGVGPGRAAALPPPPAGRALRRRAPPGRHLTAVTWRGARHLATANGAPGGAVSPPVRRAGDRNRAGSGHGHERPRGCALRDATDRLGSGAGTGTGAFSGLIVPFMPLPLFAATGTVRRGGPTPAHERSRLRLSSTASAVLCPVPAPARPAIPGSSAAFLPS